MFFSDGASVPGGCWANSLAVWPLLLGAAMGSKSQSASMATVVIWLGSGM